MNILGISCYYHDSSASILVDGKIEACVQEERFTRIKNDSDFPINSIQFCLEYTGLNLDQIDSIVFYDKPTIKFERILSTFYHVAPKGLLFFLKSIPVWLKEKLFMRKNIHLNLRKIQPNIRKEDVNLLFSEHHLSHAASAFYPSNFRSSAILTIDGVGEWCTSSISFGNDKKIKILKELHFPHSLGLLFSAFTYYLGFKVNLGEYKLMGLAPYGIESSIQTKQFINKIKTELVDIKDDGSIFLNQNFFSYTHALKMINNKKFEKLFGLKSREINENILQIHCNMALAIQKVTEEVVIKMALEAKKLTNSKNLCLSGGVALNCVANGKIDDLKIFDNIFIQPASGDAGGSLGCALAVNHMYYNKKRFYNDNFDLMKGSLLGPYFSSKEIMIMNKKFKTRFVKENSFESVIKIVAKLILEGNVIGWFQGRSEFGPRSLGNRSILADPKSPGMQKKLNLKIKSRESFRPFAPSVLEEDYHEYFVGENPNPYMLMVKKIKNEIKIKTPVNYSSLNYLEKLYTERSELQSITHVDFSARIQSVSKKNNLKFWSLINEFKKKSGYGVLLNTSFNVKGEPIVNSPEDAYKCFLNTEMDFLIIGNFVYDKKRQVINPV